MENKETLLKDRYSLIRLLGRGGMGEVYLANDIVLSREVAVKKVSYADNDLLLKAAEKEAQVLARLQHPGLPKVLDCFADNKVQYIVMEYVSGKDLGELLQLNKVPFSTEQVLDWAEKLLDILVYLHRQSPPIVHRDIKPANVKITEDGKLILLDFGLVKDTPTRVAAGISTPSVFGYSHSYAPLEQINGDATSVQTDVYELCATLYHLLTNVKPADALDRAAKRIANKPDPLRPANEVNSKVPLSLSQTLEDGLRLNNEDRIKTIDGLRGRLIQKAARDFPPNGESDEETHVIDSSVRQRSVFASSNRRKVFAIAGIPMGVMLLLIVGTIAALYLFKNPDYDALQGVWEYTDADNNEKAVLIVEGDFVRVFEGSGSQKFELQSGKSPKQFKILGTGTGNEEKKDMYGIYELSSPHTLKVAVAVDQNKFPSQFTKENTWLFEYKGKSANFIPSDTNYLNGIASWNYLVELRSVSKHLETSLPNSKDYTTFDQVITDFDAALTPCSKAREEINKMPVKGVDPELTTYVGKLGYSMSQLEQLMRSAKQLVKDMKSLVEKSNSSEANAGRFWDWMFGTQDTANELNGEKQQLQNRWGELQNKIEFESQQYDRLVSQQLELRSSLARRYNREFPSF